MASTATVTTRPWQRSTAAIAPAMSIWLITQPPKMSTAGLVSAGMASVRMVSEPVGSVGLGFMSGSFHRPTADRFLPVLAAQGNIDRLFNRHLVAVNQHAAIGTLAHHHGGLGAALADGAD